MRAIELKTLVLATFYKQTLDGVIVEVPDDVEYDPDTMVRRTFDYRLNIKGILSAPPQGEDPRVQALANIDEVRKAVAILTELKKTPEGMPLVLEDENFNYLVARVKAAKWPFVDAGILTFVDDIEHTTAMSKERVAAAVAKMEGEEGTASVGDDAVRSTRDINAAIAATAPTPRQPVSLIDAKRNGKSKEHSRR